MFFLVSFVVLLTPFADVPFLSADPSFAFPEAFVAVSLLERVVLAVFARPLALAWLDVLVPVVGAGRLFAALAAGELAFALHVVPGDLAVAFGRREMSYRRIETQDGRAVAELLVPAVRPVPEQAVA